MSEFLSYDYAAEFAYRTKYNYLLLKENKPGVDTCSLQEQRELIENEMKERRFKVDKVFEITQLINSMLGLLIFPQQSFFEEIPKQIPLKNLRILSGYVNNKMAMEKKYEFMSTYFFEEASADAILRHLRNAISHKKLKIHPEPHGGPRTIDTIVFEDSATYHFDTISNQWKFGYRKGKNNKKCEFRIAFHANDLEGILFEISDCIINIRGNL